MSKQLLDLPEQLFLLIIWRWPAEGEAIVDFSMASF